ncbi:hypothetical protein [Ectopseudomonas mendocina]|nr:hypothetical protein [Pseudomonas mendocina]
MSAQDTSIRLPALAITVLACWLSPISAATEAELNATLSEAASRVMTARTIKALCDERSPDSESMRRDALASWSHRNDIAEYDKVINALSRNSDAFRKEMESNLTRARSQIAQALAEDSTHCTDLATFLADEKYAIKPVIRKLRRLVGNFGLDIAEKPSSTSPTKVKPMGLAHLTALADAEMANVGSYEGALKDRNLRNAREDRLQTYLKNQGLVAGYGRVVSDNRLREWRGAQQSRFSLSCRSFQDKAQETRMKNALGQNMVVVGQPRNVIDGKNAEISLRDCQLFTLEQTQESMPQANDEAGLVHRPPEAAEVYAGPGKGIAMNKVDRVLYVADFQNRMDGFGNGYTSREEDIYVLLSDGTAYHHTWNFPFTDLDVTASKTREPEHWLTWSKGWAGKITLSRDGGEVDLSNAQELASLSPDTRLDHSYYFLNVGVGGSRRDRSFIFRPDGTVTHKRGGFFAGNFGTSYIIATNNRDDSVTSTYRFEDYALVLSTAQGEERRFFAVLEDSDKAKPEDVIVDGEVYWTRKKEQ